MDQRRDSTLHCFLHSHRARVWTGTPQRRKASLSVHYPRQRHGSGCNAWTMGGSWSVPPFRGFDTLNADRITPSQ
jgi:hypothetical protein